MAVALGALVHSGTSWTLSRAVDHVVPMTFVDSVRRRLVALGDEARTVLAAAAILGRRFDWDLRRRSRDSTRVVVALPRRSDTQIVAVDQDARFRHALRATPCWRSCFRRNGPGSLHALWTPSSRRIRACPATGASWPPMSPKAPATGVAPPRCCSRPGGALDGGALTTAETTLERACCRRRGTPSPSTSRSAWPRCWRWPANATGRRGGESLLAQLGSGAALAHRRAEAHLRLARAEVAGPVGPRPTSAWRERRQRRPTLPTTGCGPASTWWPPRWRSCGGPRTQVLARRPRRGRAARPPGGGVRGAGGHRPVRTAARPRRKPRPCSHAPTRSPMGTDARVARASPARARDHRPAARRRSGPLRAGP